MNDLTRRLLVANGGVVSTPELAGVGLDGHDVRHLVARGELARVRAGSFVGG